MTSKEFTPRYRFNPSSELEPERVRKTISPPEEYEDRTGYDVGFINSETAIQLPVLSTARLADVASYEWKGKRTHVLDYVHFSTVVSMSRRMPMFSACNIDGASWVNVKRNDDWKYDPRISKEYQELEGPYGNQKDGYFSRGHMTRRQDPDWGGKKVAALADQDTFHATNAAPQVQSFNGGLWGKIEDYVLKNCDKDNMRISVFTGPIFDDSDPEMFDMKIPLQFWKVIAFIDDESKTLRATGYVSSQAEAVGGLKPTFVFGQFQHQQRPLAAIEALAQLSFGDLKSYDVLQQASESFASALHDVRDIMLS
ncbi:DNA/RNA non-specific endonuclease [Massilia jejuensis]|uniref:DNA/RNA non-specific endonuclease n=1 Tax=Massilia jejuensis TaxID=648894 RepID=A0ABW0PPS0_9BURK